METSDPDKNEFGCGVLINEYNQQKSEKTLALKKKAVLDFLPCRLKGQNSYMFFK